MAADPLALAAELLRCPSVTPAEGGALAVLERLLKAAGFTVHRLTFAEAGGKSAKAPSAAWRRAPTSQKWFRRLVSRAIWSDYADRIAMAAGREEGRDH